MFSFLPRCKILDTSPFPKFSVGAHMKKLLHFRHDLIFLFIDAKMESVEYNFWKAPSFIF